MRRRRRRRRILEFRLVDCEGKQEEGDLMYGNDYDGYHYIGFDYLLW